ncbi:ribonuclease activity regulator RraA [Caballeronia telluris]|uniref:Transferase n=1 Tax=Caballeronia telluris TaxID=326475 RepID=A0A158K6K5_9BURK|nr:ribonuclease activity regulator RraA [Caballeronia telluris]SAL76764.1 transferase [Caballeronia telluris]
MTQTSALTPENRSRLRGVSIATLTTALFKRGFSNVCIQGVTPVNPAASRMVGEAYTLRYIPAREDLDTLSVFADKTHPQRRGVEEIPPGQVMVIDSRKDPRAASAGGILISRMMMRGAAGVVTDGGFRDTPDLRTLNFPCYAARPSAPTNLIHHHAADLNVPIACGDVAVYPGDVIVGDAEGVVVIPAHIANEIAEEAAAMTIFEDWVDARVREGRSTFGLYPPDEATRAEFESWKASSGQ